MEIGNGATGEQAMAFAGTIHHDGSGGVADTFETDAGVFDWLRANDITGDDDAELPERVRQLRRATRCLFAATVTPRPASRTEQDETMSTAEALRLLSDAIVNLDVTASPHQRDGKIVWRRDTAATGMDLTLGSLAVAVVDFLDSPYATDLRACQAPRCVRYFVKQHGRQVWCKDSCANRARVARHAARHKGGGA